MRSFWGTNVTRLCKRRFHGLLPGLALSAALSAAICAAICAAMTAPARAQEIISRPYAELLHELDSREGFEAWPRRAEPGHLLQAPHRAPGLHVGSHFAGQRTAILTRRVGGRHDALQAATADAPLTLAAGPPGQGLAVAHHRGFGSNAAFPVGPDGFDRISGRGEGSLAILFDRDQRATGLLIHADYPDPLGTRPAPRGMVEAIALARDGRVLGRIATPLGPGITALGLQSATGLPEIAGLVILNTDPGGIAVDDILFSRAALIGAADTALEFGPDISPGNPADRAGLSWQNPVRALLLAHALQTAQRLPGPSRRATAPAG